MKAFEFCDFFPMYCYGIYWYIRQRWSDFQYQLSWYSLSYCAGTRLSLDSIKRRLQTSANKYTHGAQENEDAKVPLFTANIVLAIPTIVLRPSLDDVQQTVNKAVQVIMRMAQDIPLWAHTIISQRAALKVRVTKIRNIYLFCLFFLFISGISGLFFWCDVCNCIMIFCWILSLNEFFYICI